MGDDRDRKVVAVGDKLDAFIDRAKRKPSSERPPDKQCEGRGTNGDRCTARVSAFPIFGKWQQNELCKDCRDQRDSKHKRKTSIKDALRASNLSTYTGQNVELGRTLEQWTDADRDKFAYIWNKRGVRDEAQAATRRFVMDRTSGISSTSAYYVDELILYDRLRPGGQDWTVDQFVGFKLLTIDGLGRRAPSEWAESQLFAILSERQRLGRKTLVGSSLTLDELGEVARKVKTGKRVEYVAAYTDELIYLLYQWAGGDEGRQNNQFNHWKV